MTNSFGLSFKMNGGPRVMNDQDNGITKKHEGASRGPCNLTFPKKYSIVCFFPLLDKTNNDVIILLKILSILYVVLIKEIIGGSVD